MNLDWWLFLGESEQKVASPQMERIDLLTEPFSMLALFADLDFRANFMDSFSLMVDRSHGDFRAPKLGAKPVFTCHGLVALFEILDLAFH